MAMPPDLSLVRNIIVICGFFDRSSQKKAPSLCTEGHIFTWRIFTATIEKSEDLKTSDLFLY